MRDQSQPFAKRASDTVAGVAMYAPIALAKLLPYRLRIPFLGWLTSRIVAPIAGYGTRVRENLAHVLPDLSDAEVKRLMRSVPDNAGRNMAELFSAAEFSARLGQSRFTGPGLAAIRTAQTKGRPIIIVTGHFGSFNAVRVGLVQQGLAMAVFFRRMSNPWFNKRYTAAMGALSQPMFEQGHRGMKQTIRHLRAGGALTILTDLNAYDGVPLDFFGKPALTPLTAAKLALKFDALLVPCWGIRLGNGLDFDILIEAPVTPTDPVRMTQEVNQRLEAQVRQHMDQWFWIHRRWKGSTDALTGPATGERAENRRTH